MKGRRQAWPPPHIEPRCRLILHPGGQRRIAIIARRDSFFAHVEELRERVTLDAGSGAVLGWPAGSDLRFDILQVERDDRGEATGHAPFERIMTYSMFASARDAEEDALMACQGYRTLH